MNKVPVIAIFDIGKTNKKLFLFDEQYKIVFEKTSTLKETVDQDGDPQEDVALLEEWVKTSFKKMMELPGFEVKAINYSAYGASLVHITNPDRKRLPIDNYLKPYPKNVHKEFYDTYGDEIKLAKETASPVLGNLNSGMQLYRIKKQNPEIFQSIYQSLHLPQYIGWLIHQQVFSDISSIGCHTMLWDFEKNYYHDWVMTEEIEKKLASIKKASEVVEVSFQQQSLVSGIGMHDSSAALVPYLILFNQPFILISTGTWCISLNPFNKNPLTEQELKSDCLCYIEYQGQVVKASRLFAGHEHEQQIQKLAKHFSKPVDYYKGVQYNTSIIEKLKIHSPVFKSVFDFPQLTLDSFENYEEAYHQLLINIMELQIASTELILNGADVKKIFVDGGFSKNDIYMNLMASAFPEKEVYAASVAQASALGAALAIHPHWNRNPIPNDIIELKIYHLPNNQE